jgi:hypothetical protein
MNRKAARQPSSMENPAHLTTNNEQAINYKQPEM